MIQSLSYGAFNPSLDMQRLMSGRNRFTEKDHVEVDFRGIVTFNTDNARLIKAGLLEKAVKYAESGHDTFADTLLDMAASYE